MTNIENNNNAMNETVNTNYTAITTTLSVPEVPSYFNPPALQNQSNCVTTGQLLQYPEFPDANKLPDGKLIPLNTMNNLKALLVFLGIDYEYDVILKNTTLKIDALKQGTDDMINSQFAYIRSQCVIYGLSINTVDTYLLALIDQSSSNPLMDMVKSTEWDGEDRITQVSDCFVTNDEGFYVKHVTAMWLIQCVAAWDYLENCPNEDALPRFESVLVLVGEQGLSKTKFYEGLLPKDYRKYITTGTHLDTHNKDSIKLAITAGITELGELDSTFTKDIGSLKAFMSKPIDRMRLPYARSEIEYKRRTSFGASVNASDFLVDRSGNRRFLPTQLEDILEEKFQNIDKYQLFSQVYHEYTNGKRWWIDKKLDKEVYDYLNQKHTEHLTVSAEDEIVEKVIINTLNSDKHPIFKLEWKSATDIARFYGFPITKRAGISSIKKQLINAKIERKGSNFKVFLMDETISIPVPISK